MTWLKIIFPIYLLMLTCLPCADNCGNEMQPTQTNISANSNHTHNDKEKESCSPFCVCACCGVQIPQPQTVDFIFIETLQYCSNQFSNYKFYCQSVQFNIWQPPQHNC